MKNENLKNSIIFPKGEKFEAEFFTGNVWVEMLSDYDKTFNCPVGNVTFEPGCINNWHKHAGGQILLITGGLWWYQEENKKAQKLKEGDIIRIPPNVKHWHGAAKDSWFVHISIETNVNEGQAEWLEPVNYEEYKKLE